MKIFDIVQLNFKQLIRDKKNLFFLLLFPAIFMLIFGASFGGDLESDISIAIINHDDGAISNQFVNVIKDFNSSENEKLFTVYELDSESEAQKMLKNASVSTILIIPQGFASNVGENQSSLGELIIKGNTLDTDYGIASSVIAGITSEFSKEIVKEISGQSVPEISLKCEDLNLSSSSMFDLYAPGLIVFAIIMTITVVASNIATEEESGMIKRLKLSKMKTKDYVLGNLISWSFVGVVQVIIMLLVAVQLGFKWEGGFYTLFLACIIGIFTTFSSVAVALIIVAISKNAKQASSISPIIAVPLSFIAGSFIPLPDCVIATINGQQVQIYEILPWNQAITAIRQVLTYGQGFNTIAMNLVIILIMGIILLAISILLFNRKISPEN